MAESGKRVILLVEAEPLPALARKVTLERHGYAVISANSGNKAVEIAKNTAGIDLILIDIDLGRGLSGAQTARSIPVDREIVLVFLSSRFELETAAQTEGIRCHGYIVSSAADAVLLATIRMAFRLAEENHRIVGRNAQVAAASAQLRLINQRLPWWSGIAECVVETELNAIAILDRELNFMYVNDRFAYNYRVAESWAIGRHYSELFPETLSRWKDVHRRALSGETLRSGADYFMQSDGSIDSTRWECRPWYETGGAVGGIVLYTEAVMQHETSALVDVDAGCLGV